MSILEVKVWQPICDRCRRHGPVMFSERVPSPPNGWGYETHHDCGMTGYTARRLYCGECLQRRQAARPEDAS